MEVRKFNFLREIFICSFIAILFLNNLPAAGQDGKEYEEFLKQPRLYSSIINYLRKERKAERSFNYSPRDFVVLAAVDLFLSLFCLWLAMFVLTATKSLSVKRYLWFIFIFNFIWFIFLMLCRIGWQILDFLIIRLRPDLGAAFVDNLSLVAIVFAGIIYLWPLARTFGLNFYGALGVFSVSHLFYFLIIVLFFIFAGPKENMIFNLVKENLGIRQVLQSYLSDVDKVISGQNALSFIRIRPFHL